MNLKLGDKIIENKARCRSCGTILVSDFISDPQICSCGKLKVTGGAFYLKRMIYQDGKYVLAENDTDYEEQSKFYLCESN